MNLQRPLVTLDVETSGLDTMKDAIFFFAAIKHNPDGQVQTYQTLIKPWKPIPPEVEALTGTTNADVEKATLFPEVAQAIIQFIAGCDLCGFGLIHFDVQILWEEFYRIGIPWDLTNVALIDAGTIFKLKEPRDLTAALRFYCDRKHEGAHGALADAQATADVFRSQMERYGELRDLPASALSQFCQTDKDGSMRMDLAGVIVRDKNGVPRYTHKKVRGVAVADEMSYAGWLLRSDFSEQTKRVVRAVLEEIESKGQGALL